MIKNTSYHYTIFVTCEFNAMYRIGLIQTDSFTVSVGTMESIGPIILKVRKAKY